MDKDEIDELVDWQLSGHGRTPQIQEFSNEVTCPVCKGTWHGMGTSHCPGSFDGGINAKSNPDTPSDFPVYVHHSD